MNEDKEQEEKEEPIIMLIPDCCREHWDTCPHVVNKDYKPRKGNIGL